MKALLLILAGLVAGVGMTVGAQALQDNGDGTDTSTDTPASIATTPVMRQDIVLTDESVATLEFVDSVALSAPAEGTITSVVADGSTVEAGTVIATIDSSPVVAMYGEVPGYRDLDDSSSDGVDVYQLETNLVALGFDPDGAIDIDREFDDATENAVELWQTSLGLDADGIVLQSLIVFTPGKVLIDGEAAAIGSSIQEGGQLAVGRVLERTLLVPSTSEVEGAVTSIAPTGTSVGTGTVLFLDGTTPVVAVTGDVAAGPILERDLSASVSDGADVKLLERMLVSQGFDAAGALVVDDDFDEITSQAVYDWYVSLGTIDPANEIEVTDVVVPAGSFVVVPDGLVVGSSFAAEGEEPTGDQPVLALTTAARTVSTTAPIDDTTFELGAPIEIEYPDGTTVAGTVTDIGTVATNPTGDPEDTPTVSISITPAQIPDSVLGFVQIPVTLRVVTETIEDAYVVPVSALVALAEGGHALEVADSETATHLIGVETGTFQGGFVEVISDELSTDVNVVVPS